ncbi:uncharacterized protein I303_101158 [Kwoniella dejecticola CBS 10117]|uniref:Protein CPL1-like domain-containing protein n=1 Tax=Kwoniella dejecticola CBS 10117 TaxID=1296121 RepID=A0A1A6AH03_9TREE|nr:uncharacterized protein I303_01165 [Kwoniella dejecticola CBS 10117]OBR89339.1 hypothetical protein I303_01165 [Kwoniella dejecticola CBS 10117]
MIFPKIAILSLLSLSSFVISLPTPTLNNQEGLARRWYEDHKRHHPSAGENARPSPSVSGGAKRKAKKPIPSTTSNEDGNGSSQPLLGAAEDLTRCPAQQMACPVSPMTDVQLAQSNADTPYECILPQEDLYSCGGCTTLGTGLDCTAIPGVLSVSCAIGSCNVHSCKPGFTVTSDGQGCVEVITSSANSTVLSTEQTPSVNTTESATSPVATDAPTSSVESAAAPSSTV